MCIGIYNMIVGCIHVDVFTYLYLCVHVLCPGICMQVFIMRLQNF